jgi:TPR repeat protein
MKRFFLILLFLPIVGSNILWAESHNIKMADQVNKFENAVKLVAEKKYIEAVEEFKNLADLGLPEAQFNLAILNLNGLGAPKNFKNALYWSWYAYLNKHETAFSQAEAIFPSITEALRDEVATQIIEELLVLANDGDQGAALKLGQTYTQLFVTPDYKSAYVWLSIAQAYGLEEVTELLENATKQLTLEEVLQQQDESADTFSKIKR